MDIVSLEFGGGDGEGADGTSVCAFRQDAKR